MKRNPISEASPPNPYEASAVKWADGCTTGVDWPSVKHIVNRLCQAIAADLISIAGHST